MKGKAGPVPQERKTPMHAQPLPGLEDREIKPLQDAAVQYAKIRDRRQVLTTEEVELKDKVLKLMKAHKREHYEYDGVSIDLVVEQESVKVKVKKEKEDE